MVNKSRWKGVHDKFPAHVEEAKNSDGNVHRGYSLLEFRVAAELLRVGPVHSTEDYWAPSDWQLLLVVSEYMSALLEFLDWFWPDLGWEHHKQAIVLSKRLLQPRSPHTYPDLQIDPQLRAAWQSFTYCFWHGTRHLPAAPPVGESPAVYSAAREWLTKLVGERGFEAEGHIVSSLQSWIQSTRPRLQEAFPSIDWSRWPSIVWPDLECAYRGVEKRGAIKRRQQEEEYAVRWPLRVTQGRPKFNHLKLEARDGFVVGIPPVKNPPVLGFLAVSDVMCAFKQAAGHWPSAQPGSPTYLVQQDVVQSFVLNVLRETRGPLAPGIDHEKYRYLGYVACSVLGWNRALSQLEHPVRETAAWGRLPLLLPGGTAALMYAENMRQEQQLMPQLGAAAAAAAAATAAATGVDLGQLGAAAPALPSPLDSVMRVDLGIAAQLAALTPDLLLGADTEAALAALHLPPPTPTPLQPLPQSLVLMPEPQAAPAATAGAPAGFFGGAAAGAYRLDTTQGFGSVPLPSASPMTAASIAAGGVLLDRLAGQYSAPIGGGALQTQPCRPEPKPTRPRASPFARGSTSATAGSAAVSANAGPGSSAGASPVELPPPPCPPLSSQPAQQPCQQAPQPQPQPHDQEELAPATRPQPTAAHASQRHPKGRADPHPCGEFGDRGAPAGDLLEGLSAPMSLGGLSSMQDLIDGLPSQADLTWSAILAAVGDDGGAAAAPGAVGEPGGAGPSGTTSELQAGLPSLLLPSWSMLRPPPASQQQESEPQAPPVSIPQYQQLSVQVPSPAPSPGLPPSPALLQPLDSGLPYGGLLQPPPPPPRLAPDAPVHVHPPRRAVSPCQATITTGLLPLPSTSNTSSGLIRPEMSGPEPRFGRRSHGEVFTLSPVTSCGPNGETVPCSPAPATLAGAAAATSTATAGVAEEANGPEGLLHMSSADEGARFLTTRSGGSFGREKLSVGLPRSGRRTRQDVAAAAAAAAADQGLLPAPGSIVERSAKRPNAQAGPLVDGSVVPGTAERVESLGAFLNDQQTGLVTEVLASQPLSAHRGPTGLRGACAGDDADVRAALGLELLQLLRAWAGSADAALRDGDTAGAAADIRRQVEKLLGQGASVDVVEGDATAPSTATEPPTGPAGYTALHWACAREDAALAELLISHGADPDRCDAAGTPARLVNPGFATQLAEVVARCAQRRADKPDTQLTAAAGAATVIRASSQTMTSVFASSAGTVAAAAAAAAGAATAHPDSQLRSRLEELLRSADRVAAQLARKDPQAAAGHVLQAMRDTDFLFRCIVSGTAK